MGSDGKCERRYLGAAEGEMKAATNRSMESQWRTRRGTGVKGRIRFCRAGGRGEEGAAYAPADARGIVGRHAVDLAVELFAIGVVHIYLDEP